MLLLEIPWLFRSFWNEKILRCFHNFYDCKINHNSLSSSLYNIITCFNQELSSSVMWHWSRILVKAAILNTLTNTEITLNFRVNRFVLDWCGLYTRERLQSRGTKKLRISLWNPGLNYLPCNPPKWKPCWFEAEWPKLVAALEAGALINCSLLFICTQEF